MMFNCTYNVFFTFFQFGQTPLHYAAAYGHQGCISVLTRFGANVFALDRGKFPSDSHVFSIYSDDTCILLRINDFKIHQSL